MTGTKCQGCGADQTNGLALCDLCQMKVAGGLEFIPIYFKNLARWRPGRAGSRPVPASREPRGTSTEPNDRVSRVLDEAGAEISTWARALADERDVELPAQQDEGTTVAALCRLLAESMTSIGTLDWCGEFVRSVDVIETRLRKLTDEIAPGWYAGGCKVCNSGTYVVPGLTWVTCRVCGSTTYARDHLPTILEEARDWVAPPKRMAEALVALVDGELSVPRLHDRIRKWGQRERIVGVRRVDLEGDPTGPNRYTFGDVLDVLRSEGQTRLGESGRRAS